MRRRLPDRGCSQPRQGADRDWDTVPENVAFSKEALYQLDRALSALPPRQRKVVTMRDVCGMTADEVCATLNISPRISRSCCIASGPSCVRPSPATTVDDLFPAGERARDSSSGGTWPLICLGVPR